MTVTITIVIHPARPAVSNTGAAYNGTNHTAHDRARRPCDNGSGACSDCRAGEGAFLRIRRHGKSGQYYESRSNANHENFMHDRLSFFPCMMAVGVSFFEND
jgi:hypothetical protein